MKIYWAAPLFTDTERRYNEVCVSGLERAGFCVYLPQRDAGLKSSGISCEVIYEKDVEALIESDAIIAVLHGNDEGTLFEVGYMAASEKPIFLIGHTDNCMFCKAKQFDTFYQCLDYLSGNKGK